MAFLSNVLLSVADTVIKEPSWLWEKLLLHVFNFIGNYGWRVVFFTVCLKLLLCPLDIYQRYKARKNQKITERLKPEMEKLQKQYAGDRNMLAQKQMQLNKQAGISYFSSCLPAIITMAVMFSLLGALNEVSQYMNFKEYYEMYNVYNEAVVEYNEMDDAAKQALRDQGVVNPELVDGDGNPVLESQQYGQNEVYEFYQANKTSFLWIKNIWSPDVPWKKEVNSYKQFISNIGKRGSDASKSGIDDATLASMKGNYDVVMGKLLAEGNNGANGYLVLPILSVLFSVATQWLSMRQQKQSGQMNEAMGGGTMKTMMFIMPVMIGFFSLSYTAAFSLYLIISYAFSLALQLSSNAILLVIDKAEEKKVTTTVQKYGRPDPSVTIQKYGRPDPNDFNNKNDKDKK